jgi:hypothetical protein
MSEYVFLAGSTPLSGDASNEEGNHQTSTYVRTGTGKELWDQLPAERLMLTERP